MNYKSVLFIGPNYRIRKGGIASVLKEYEIYLGHDFNFLSSIYFQNVIFGIIFFPINIVVFIFKLLLDRDIKIVHIHGSARGSFYRKYILFIIAKFVFKKIIVYHVHAGNFKLFFDDCSNFMKDRICFLINKCDQLIVLSEEWETYFRKTFNPRKIDILENIVPKPLKVNKSFKNESLRLLFLGRIGQNKGIYDLITCLGKNKDSFKDKIELVIGGDGNSKRLEEKIRQYKLGFVKNLGWVENEEKQVLLMESDIFILPSYNEGLPISILEAMSYKMPIIATPVGGIPRVVKNGVNGVLVTPGNLEQLKEALLFYITDKQKLKEHGIESEKMVAPYFPESVFFNLEGIYSSFKL